MSLQSNGTFVALVAGAGLTLTAPASAQASQASVAPGAYPPSEATAESGDVSEIVVTARRAEERLQDVPISIAVLDQRQLAARNVVSPTDLALSVPSLGASSSFNNDMTAYAIRGFVQDLGTAPSVGVYFNDVVAPRGGSSVTAGDGAGPGMYFDLQNVQVLMGPQGTLFGRNTTGGAVLLVPQPPTDRHDGYLELSLGNFGAVRTQAVLNAPVSEQARFRLAIDHLRHDGYTRNIGGGPNLDDQNYTSIRLSGDMDFGSPLTNRVVSYFTRSSNHGSVPIMVGCNPDAFPFGVLACGGPDSQFTVQQRLNNPYIAQSAKTDPISALRVWGVINTTTWRSGSSITVKNIMSYAQLRQSYRSDLFGTAFRLPPILNYPLGGGVSIPIPTGALAGTPLAFTDVNDLPGGSVSNQSTFTEELQVQGLSPDKSLAWQAGIYFEASRPLSANTGTQTATAINCRDLARLQCIDVLGEILGRPIGGASAYRVSIRHHDMGLYAQSTYAITPKLSVTAGLRYTWDRVTATSNLVTYLFPAPDTPVKACLFSTTTLADNCFQQLRTTSSAPTGLIGVEYKPTSSLLLYAKYSLGYRQGGVSATSAEGYQTFGPEHIDAYEMGAKWGFGGPIPGHLNIAAFYNELSNQQLSVVFIPKTASVSIAEGKVNAGRSLTEGIEIDLGLGPAPGLHLTLGYTYLFTELKSLAPILIPAESMYAYAVPYQQPGGRLVYSPRNKLTADIRYAFPIPEVMGKVTFGASYTWTDSQVANISSPFGVLPAFGLLNLSLDWRGIARSPIDLEFYATNVANTAYAVYDNALYESAGFGGHRYGAPRMYGVRLRYSFGR